jgi:hypothetical protein
VAPVTRIMGIPPARVWTVRLTQIDEGRRVADVVELPGQNSARKIYSA